MYGACTAAEKAARPEALRDIGRILKDSSWQGSVRPSAAIHRIFVWTFGEKHLSWRCVIASILATVATLIVLSFRDMHAVLENFAAYRGPWLLIIFFATTSFLPDYVALYKTRLLLLSMHSRASTLGIFIVVDITLSLVISAVSFAIVSVLTGIVLGIQHAAFPQALHEAIRGLEIQISWMPRGLWVFYIQDDGFTSTISQSYRRCSRPFGRS